MGSAIDHPIEGIKGAAKGIANIPSELAEMLAKGSALQSAGEMEQAAAMQSLFGQTESASRLAQSAEQVRQGAQQIEVPKFSMNNPAQAGGDKIATVIQLLAGGAGIVKSGAKGLATLGKAGAGIETQVAKGAVEGEHALSSAAKAAGTTDVVKTADVVADGGKAETAATAPKPETPKPAGDGVKIVERIKSLREKYLGRTPGKSSKTGREVQDRMRAEGKLREDAVTGKTEFQASNKKWYPLEEADMAHKTDAVTWWNQTGRQFGAKSSEVRQWMLDSKNYVLDHYSINRSLGATLGQTTNYLPPLK